MSSLCKSVSLAKPAAQHRDPILCFLSLSLLGAFACGPTHRSSAPAPSPIIEQSGGTPLYLTREEDDCHADAASAHLSDAVDVQFFEGHRSFHHKVNLSRLHGAGLRGGVLHLTWLGGRHLVKRNFVDERPSVSGGQSLNICRPDGGYQRFTAENMGLAAAYGILEAADAYTELKDDLGLAEVPPIHLWIQPEKVEEVKRPKDILRRLITDNAAWFKPAFDARFFIEVLPHSFERNRDFTGKFWEQPAVLAHEYAHHVFYHNSGERKSRPGDGDAAADEEPTRPALPGQRVRLGIEEAFADLYAYFVYQAKTRSPFSGKFSFHPGRDVEAEILLSGRTEGLSVEKRIDHNYLQLFLGEGTTGHNRELVDILRDEHALGAMIAYGLNAFYKRDADLLALSPPLQARAKMRMLLGWAQSFATLADGTNARRASEARSFLADSLLRAFITAPSGELSGRTTVSSGQCEALQAIFPVFYQEWLREAAAAFANCSAA